MHSPETKLIAAQKQYIKFLEERCYQPMLLAGAMIKEEIVHKEYLVLQIADAQKNVVEEHV